MLDDIDLSADYVKNHLQDSTLSPAAPRYHVGMVGKYILEKLLRKPVEVALASEFRYMLPHCGREHLGHRHQPVRRDVRHHGRPSGGQAAGRPRTLAIVNVVGSSIAKEVG